ncbi:DUF6691 family protein [Sphingobacterium daejeonense]|uniref:DUF6691 family protein n=1 Tax=Sphingobacterium daejeonense TaxID=371142 RepID=UPI0010C5A3B8|nr:DUF6691 family protein [Sphingobacterium daejeonense]VTP94828.1 Predicted transporter component [Sphingobacterium daejeonense]
MVTRSSYLLKLNQFRDILIGGILFGLGWPLIGACPGPIFVLIGAGVYPMLIVAGFAILGTYLYGLVKDKLPH